MYKETFRTEEEAVCFQELGDSCTYIPTVLNRSGCTCELEEVNNIRYSMLSEEKQRKYLQDILLAVETAIENNVYHFDLRDSNFGVKNDSGVLLDWNDAYFSESNDFYMTYTPVNIDTLVENSEERECILAIISIFGALLYDLNIVENKDIWENPKKYSIKKLRKVLER